jgi:glutamate-1-semialdehyde 2,1-aminomutase
MKMSKSSVPQSVMKLGLGGSVEKSRLWFERAKRVLAGGISSSARTTCAGAASHPLYFTYGRGSRIYDADGNQFIDYLLSYGSLILGHSNPGINEFLNRQIEKGTMFGTCNTTEVQLAEQICSMVPCAQLVRFANSGSEAICGAVRAARAYTGRNKILKFEGHYHGWVDVLAVSNRPTIETAGSLEAPRSEPHSMGLPPGVVDDVVVCPWNQPRILEKILDSHEGQIAAVIAEPIVANNACIMPVPGFLDFLRDVCSRRNIILIFDEIVTGFRVAPGGAQQLYNADCDIAVFSKALGGGMPISAFAGKHFIMDLVAANRAKHGGTYNGSPICASAALYTLRMLRDGQLQKKIRSTGEMLMEAIRQSARKHGVSCIVQGVGSMFQVVFTTECKPPLHYRDLFTADTGQFAVFRNSLLEQGIHINSSGLACWFVSEAHTEEDVELTITGIDKAMKSVAEAGRSNREIGTGAKKC